MVKDRPGEGEKRPVLHLDRDNHPGADIPSLRATLQDWLSC
jgi:hypothetical protein